MIKQIALGVLLTCYAFLACAKSHHPAEELAKARKHDLAATLYAHYCANCHAKKPLIELGAPRFRVQADWAPRLKNSREVFLKHLFEGIGAMPARGGCFECSDEDLLKALAYLLPSGLNLTKRESNPIKK